jgi:uncharacterized protein YbjT (DUF2867 family)
MRIFVAGASGVIGVRLVPLLVAGGHVVAGMTRSPHKAGLLRELGAEPVVCDVFDADALTQAMTAFGPDIVFHQLTDLPDSAADLRAAGDRNDRMRRARTRNPLQAGGVVLRYGQLHGPGTYYETAPPPPPRIHVDDAARQTLPSLAAPPGLTIVIDDRAMPQG